MKPDADIIDISLRFTDYTLGSFSAETDVKSFKSTYFRQSLSKPVLNKTNTSMNEFFHYFFNQHDVIQLSGESVFITRNVIKKITRSIFYKM